MELRRISKEKLVEVLREHEKWLNSNEEQGKCADLRHTNLSGINLSRANLSRANLFEADLFNVNLSEADLSGAILFGADLSGANLYGANLFETDLSGANLFGASLSGANLSRANLSRANLSRVCLSETNLSKANLSGAYLLGADLSKVDLSEANLHYVNLCNTKLENVKYDDATQYFALQCPEKGEFVAYKKAYDSESGLPRIVKLLIPADALRSSATSKKCRCNKAKVLSITSLDDKKKYQKAFSLYDASFIYEVGETVEVPDFNKDRWEECAPGIHFFMCRMDAVNKNIRSTLKIATDYMYM